MGVPQSPSDRSAISRRLFNILTHSAPGFIWVADRDGYVNFVNRAWCEYTGLSPEASFGDGWMVAIHPHDIQKVEALWPLQDAGHDPVYQTQLRFRRKDGQYRWYLVKANPGANRENDWVGFSTDVHDLASIRARDRAQVNILSKLVSGEKVEAILEALCELGEEQLPGSRCTVLLLNEEGTGFTGGAAPFLPKHIQDMIPGTRVGPGVGTCGSAAFEKRDIVSASIASDPSWDAWRDVLSPLNIKACWSRPVYGAGGRVLATFGFYFFEERSPDDGEMESLDNLRHLAAVAIEKARTSQALQESEEHHRYTVEHNPQIPWTADAHGRILTVSSRWKNATGLPVASALGNGWFQVLHPDDVDRVKGYWSSRLRTGEAADLKYRIRLTDGSFRWVRARASPRLDSHGRIVRWYGAVEDIHDLELATERLRKQAYIDDTTRIPNRRALEEVLARKVGVADGRDTAAELLIVDINGFRHVNDRFGHETGDAALRLFARHLRECVSDDAFVARVTGDQFAIVPGQILDEAPLQRLATRISRALDERLGRSTKTRNMSVSIGCARLAPGGRSVELVRRAKAALYAAKTDSNQSARLFTPGLRREVDARIEQIELAWMALRSRWLVPYYQPKVDLATGALAGAEALLRVRHPVEGVLSPLSIWAALDAPKVSRAINDRMLRLVLSDLAQWKPWLVEVGSISVNLSTEMLRQEGLGRSLLRRLEGRNLAPRQLTIEITERVLMDDPALRMRRALQDLQSRGMRVSLDDFGTGFASLTHLQRLSVNEIKIDRSFVSALGTGGSGEAIVKSMIGLGRSMGVDVVAEGVETSLQASLLRAWGCRFAQGYYFNRPLPGQEFASIGRRGGKPYSRKLAQTSVPRSM